METVKNDIKVGDKVYVLDYQYLLKGTALKVNRKTIKVSVPEQDLVQSHVKNFNVEKVANSNDIVSIVTRIRPPVESVRFEYTLYKNYAKPVHEWQEPCYYINE